MGFENIPSEIQAFPQWVAAFFSYDESTGLIYAKPRDFGKNPSARQKQWNSRYAKKPIGYPHNGYVRVSLPNGKLLYAHQIAFLLKTGEIPKEIDHKDLDRSNNVWTNLRKATHEENASNAKQRKTNKTKLKGVSWSKSNKCWRMDIQNNNIKYYSYHVTTEEARNAYCELASKLHKEFANVA